MRKYPRPTRPRLASRSRVLRRASGGCHRSHGDDIDHATFESRTRTRRRRYVIVNGRPGLERGSTRAPARGRSSTVRGSSETRRRGETLGRVEGGEIGRRADWRLTVLLMIILSGGGGHRDRRRRTRRSPKWLPRSPSPKVRPTTPTAASFFPTSPTTGSCAPRPARSPVPAGRLRSTARPPVAPTGWPLTSRGGSWPARGATQVTPRSATAGHHAGRLVPGAIHPNDLDVTPGPHLFTDPRYRDRSGVRWRGVRLPHRRRRGGRA